LRPPPEIALALGAYEQATKNSAAASPRSKAVNALMEDAESVETGSEAGVVVAVVLAGVVALVETSAMPVSAMEDSSVVVVEEPAMSSHHVVPVSAWHISWVTS